MRASDLKTALGRRHELPDWVLMFEVASAVGGGSKRFADALAICTVASRGLALHGFEIKTSKQDLKNELAEIAKADGVGRYCDFWWMVTPQKLCHPDELPLNWGLLECSDGDLHEVKAAKRNEPHPYDRPFLASMARRIGQMEENVVQELIYARLQPLRRRIEYLEQEMEEEIERRMELQQNELLRLRANIAAFEKLSGLSLSCPKEAARIATIARLVTESRLFESFGPLDRLGALLDSSQEKLQALKSQITALEPALRKVG